MKTIKLAIIVSLVSLISFSCKKKDQPQPAVDSSMTTPTPMASATYTNIPYDVLLVDMNGASYPGTFGTNRKIKVVSDGVSIDSMTTNLNTVTYLYTFRSSFCPLTPDLLVVPHNFKIQTNASNQFINYYENNVLKATLVIDNTGKIISVTNVYGSGYFIKPWSPYSCFYLCIFVA